MNVFSSLNGLQFAWDSEKAAENVRKHRVSFESAREVFFDVLGMSGDASNSGDEARASFIGMTFDHHLRYVVHVEREEKVLRIVSAREAERREREAYEESA